MAKARQSTVARWVSLGCGGIALLTVLAIIMFLCWPLRSEDVVGEVSRNDTGCTVEALNRGGWEYKLLLPGIHASDLKEPLNVYVFVSQCAGLPGGKPYAAQLLAAASGRVIARGLECAGAPASHLPCRLEATPLRRSDPLDFIVRVERVRGEKPVDAHLRVILKRKWESVVISAMMSV